MASICEKMKNRGFVFCVCLKFNRCTDDRWWWLARAKPRRLIELDRGVQCDQMARLFFNIWPFTGIKNYPKA